MHFCKIIGSLLLVCCIIPHGYAQTKMTLPSPSLPGISSDSLSGKKLVQAGKEQLAPLIDAAKSPLQQLSPGIKLFEGSKPVSFQQLGADAEYTYIQDTSGAGLGVFRELQGTFGYNVHFGVALANMPFDMSIRESNGINTMNYTPFQNFYKFNFDHTQYLESLRSKALEKISPEAITNSALTRVNSIRNQYERQLQNEINQTQQELTKEVGSPVAIPAGATNLGSSDMSALRTKLLPGTALEKYRQDLGRLQAMAQDKDPKSLASDSNYLHTLGEVKKYEALEKIYNKITSWKQRFEGNPLVKELKGQSSFSPSAMKAYLSDPKNLATVLDDQGSLSTLQKLFYNVQKLDMGQNAAESGDLALHNVVNTGVNTEFKNKSTSVGFIYGKNNIPNPWQQAGLVSQVTNEYTNLTGFKIGTGSGSPIDQSISCNFFSFNNAGAVSTQAGAQHAAYLPMAPRKDGVITLHTGLKLGGEHEITLDVSKSFGSFRQQASDSSKSVGDGSVFNNAGKANYAGILSYTGQLFMTDLKLYVKKVGLGYNNPGNALLRSGESQVGLGLARKFLQKRLSVKYDGDYRRQVFDPSGNYIYSALSNKMQLGYKLNRNDRVGLTYQRSDYHTSFYGQPSSGGVNARYQVDGSYRLFVARKRITNNITISRQEMSLPLSTGGTYSNNSLMLTQTSSVMFGKGLLSLTILNNASDNKSYYFNTSMFSAEANYAYTALGNVRLSSNLGYYANAGWNKQVGIGQQVSAVIKEQLNLDFQIGYKKAIQVIRQELANQLFVNTTVHYTFK